MSSAKISKDGKEVYIECNYGRKQAAIFLKHIDSNPDVETDIDRILFRFVTSDHSDINSQLLVTNQIVLRKDYTRVMSHIFRDVADVIDGWYID